MSNIQISHFVGLSGIGGVQRNFMEYMNNNATSGLDNNLSHKVYTLGNVGYQYKLLVDVHDIKKFKNLFSLILDIISRNKIVHFYNNLASLKVAIFLLFLPASNLVLHERGTIWNIPSNRRLLLRFVVWKSCMILANSNATKIMLENKFNICGEKIRVLHNGINTSIKCVKKKTTHKLFHIGFIGRLDTPKGVHVLIEAMSYLVDNDNIRLTIAGEGALEEILKKKAHDLNSVSFIGHVAEPYSFLRNLDLLIVPSIREPLGNVCLEAGLCKVPILAANVDGLPEIIKDKISGELISPSKKVSFETVNTAIPLPEFVVNPMTQKLETPKQIDPLLLSHKIIDLYNSPGTLVKYGEQLNNRVVEYFNIERYTYDLHKIYFEINK
jgi:glycosyltransferase involved in cell wall biosynthesis